MRNSGGGQLLVEAGEERFPFLGRGADSLVAHVYAEIGDDVEPAFSLRFARGGCPGTASGRP